MLPNDFNINNKGFSGEHFQNDVEILEGTKMNQPKHQVMLQVPD